ncbi:MAG: hypothetical protein HY096_13545 [Nitrospinae bacterium]|nr:hypothetical protein [Nitrospinota bacterium]
MGLTIIECAVCAWRATCNLKFKYEGGSSLSCHEFTRDVSIHSSHENPTAPPPDDTTKEAKKKKIKKQKPD